MLREKLSVVTVAILSLILSFNVCAQVKVVVIPLAGDDVIIEAEPATEKVMFITNGQFNGNLGGLAGADAKCQAEADAAGSTVQGKTFKAWLSDAEEAEGVFFGSGARQLNLYSLPYVNTVGITLYTSYSEFGTNEPSDPIVHDAQGSEVVDTGAPWSVQTWSNISFGARAGTDSKCLGWSNGVSADGHTGYQIYDPGFDSDPDLVSALGAVDGFSVICNSVARLICLEQ